MEKKIKYVDWGLANWYEDRIEINRNLKKYPKLHNYIILHELGHKKEFDLMHDFMGPIRTSIKMKL